MTILIVVFPVALVGLMTFLLPMLVAPTVPFGVRVPPDRVGEPVIARQRRLYRGSTGVAAIAAVIGAFFVPPWTVALLAVAELVFALLCYAVARRAVRAAKATGDWYAGLTQAVATDTTWRTAPMRFPWAWALPSVSIVVATVVVGVVRYPGLPARMAIHFDRSGIADGFTDRSVLAAFFPVFVQAFVTIVVLGLLALVYRGRPETDAADPAGSTRRYRRFLGALGPATALLVALVDAAMLVVALQLWGVVAVDAVGVGLTVALPLVAVVIVLVIAIRIGQAGARLGSSPPSGGVVNRDDDAHWVGGIFYVNRQDPALLVPRRFGVGWTINLARPTGWLILVALVVSIVALIVVTHRL